MTRVLKRLSRAVQFARALVRGARLYRRMGLPVLGLAYGVLASFFAPVGMLASPRTVRRRLKACRGCSLYDRSYRTCGDGVSVLFTEANDVVPGGCQCWLPLKTRVIGARCYMVDIGLEDRWTPST